MKALIRSVAGLLVSLLAASPSQPDLKFGRLSDMIDLL